jgi:secondary thiamine-phosphate synthase enzyme
MKKILKFNTDKLFKNITSDCVSFVKNNNFSNGILLVYSRHTTCCLKILEDEILHKADVRFFLDKMAPKWKDPEGDQKNIKYLHDLISLREDVSPDEPINGHSHIRSLFFNTSVSIPVIDHELTLGKWQSIFAIELDPNRDRELILFYLGS